MQNKKYKNLKPWKPGQSGNPAGRKPGSKNVSIIVRELLEQDVIDDVLGGIPLSKSIKGKSTSYAQAIVLVMIQKALGTADKIKSYLLIEDLMKNYDENVDLVTHTRESLHLIKQEGKRWRGILDPMYREYKLQIQRRD